MEAKAVVLFDLDGTLIHSRDAILFSISKVLEESGHGPLKNEDVKFFVGVPLSQALKHWTKDPRPMVKRFQQVYLENFEETTAVCPGAVEMLDALKGRVPMGLITLKGGGESREVLAKLGLSGYFDHVFGDDGPDETPYHIKPHPQHFFFALNRMGVLDDKTYGELKDEPDLRGQASPFKQAAVVYLGDADADMIGARRAGITPVGASWGVHPKERLMSAGAEEIIDEPAGFLRFLRKRGVLRS